MKKVIVVSKTHLDLGFTNYARVIRQNYIEKFIPQAIELARQLNTAEKKRFVWTTGSWIIKEVLVHGTPEQKENLTLALKNGDIAPHALAFTTHTELFDADTLEYSLSVVDSLDKICGRKTIAAKLTDVPGHTRAIVPYLAKRGIKLLHIGVNGASALPKVPECFLWKDGDSEIIVIYSGGYGGEFKCGALDDILYFDHTLDNHGAPSAEKAAQKFTDIEKQYPGYEVVAGRMDDFAELIWEKRAKLPVFEGEIGDTWIHGSASDPYKSAALREMMLLKKQWLTDQSMIKNSEEYTGFSDALICVAEHTCGMDMKMFFADYENYLKRDFTAARAHDTVELRHLLRDFPQNFLTAFARMSGKYKKGSYSTIEKSWKEQREYIDKAVSCLSEEHAKEAKAALNKLIPQSPEKIQQGQINSLDCFSAGGWSFQLNKLGGIGKLTFNGKNVIKENNNPVVEYCSYGKSDYDFWFSHYTRDIDKTAGWAYGDFGRPLLKYADKKYPQGRFNYSLKSSEAEKTNDGVRISAMLECDKKLSEELGAPRSFQILYTLTADGLKIEVLWFKKDANRLTEALFLRLFPNCSDLSMTKINENINPLSVVEDGGRNISAVFRVNFSVENQNFKIINKHAPLLSIGKGKILQFDNKLEDCGKDGISYILYNNVWGTNFPLWYEDNAYFDFEITENKD